MSLPARPSNILISNLTGTSFTMTIVDGSAGSTPIDMRNFVTSRGNDPMDFAEPSQQYLLLENPTKSYTFTGLTQGATYNVWGRARNAEGWGPFSIVIQVIPSTVPPAPDAVVLTNVKHDRVHAEFSGNGNGGQPVIEWQIGYGTSTTTATSFATGFDIDITGLATNTTYYFWARGRNGNGWGPWGPRSSAKTTNVPPYPSAPVITNITQNSLHATFTSNGDGGEPILEYQIGYGTDPGLIGLYASGSSIDITNLVAGQTFYLWARVRNAAGWSPWSARSSAVLLRGAWVKVGTVWKEAVPYVRVSGVWKVARPWTKIAGVWKEDI